MTLGRRVIGERMTLCAAMRADPAPAGFHHDHAEQVEADGDAVRAGSSAINSIGSNKGGIAPVMARILQK